MDTLTTVVFLTVVAGRFILPLFLFKFPLPAIIACLILDGYDQSIFQAFGADPPGYQSYDKAMDIFYLSMAYLSTLRNWRSEAAFRVAWFLFFYRMVGVVLFEATGLRWVLLVFPNTFEYFFIVYEAIRTRWNPARWGYRFWVAMAAAIWIVVKWPQEYWIHIAQMDMSETLAEHPWVWGVLAGLALLLVLGAWVFSRRTLGQPDHDFTLVAPPIPLSIDNARARNSWIAQFDAIRSVGTLEKVILISLVSTIYGQVLPDYDGSSTWLFFGIAGFVVINSVFSIATARRNWTVQGAFASFFVRLVFNLVLVTIADWLLNRSEGDIHGFDTFFFLSLISLMTTLHDRYRPVHATMMRSARQTDAQAAPMPR